MNDLRLWRWTGVFGLAAGLLLLVASPLYVIERGAPPSLGDATQFADYVAKNNVIGITTKLVDTFYVVGFILFVTGLSSVIRRLRADYDWFAGLILGSGLMMSAMILVGNVLAGGAVLDTFSHPDPTAVRALTEASLFAFGAITFTLTALTLAVISYTLLATRVLPAWVGWWGGLVAALHAAAIPTVYLGNDFMEVVIAGGSASAGLYSYISAIAGFAYIVWQMVIALLMIRKREPGV